MPMHVMIIGAGIGGLSLAILLAQAGHRVSMFERRPSYDNISSGGGINVTANAIICIEAMGLAARIERICDRVPQIVVKRYQDGRTLATNPTSKPHVMLHRNDLLTLLYERVTELGVDVRFEQRIRSIDSASAAPTVYFEDGTSVEGDFVVGTDGVNSRVRQLLFPNLPTGSSLTADCVFLVDVPHQLMSKYPETAALVDLPPYQFWLGPGRSIVAWYMTSRKSYHLQFCDHEFNKGEAYGAINADEAQVSRYEDMDMFAKRWADGDDAIRTIVTNTQSCVKWRIATAPPLPSWSNDNGRVILLGDAAHAFPPFAGQGACMAIEDAACLATLFAHATSSADLATVAGVFESVRRPRCEKVHRIVIANVVLFSMHDGEKQRARDEMLTKGTSRVRDSRIATEPEGTGQGPGGKRDREGQSQGSSPTASVENYDAIEEATRGWRLYMETSTSGIRSAL